jgi:magnesium transporter
VAGERGQGGLARSLVRLNPARGADLTDLKTALRSRNLAHVQHALAGRGGTEIADELLRLDHVDQAVLFRVLPKPMAVRVFERLDRAHQRRLLDALRADEVSEVLEQLPADDRARLLDEVPAGIAARLLASVSLDERARTMLLLGYEPESAGRIMTPDYVSVTAEMSAQQALDRVRQAGIDAETIYLLYVVDDARRLLGVVTLKDVVLAHPGTPVARIMSADPVRAATDEDQEDVARRLAANDLLALPVVDREDRLVGIITIDDAMAVLERETTEDLTKIGGAQPLDEPYLTAGVTRVFRSRVGWLLVLFVAEALTGTIMRVFEDTLQSVVALAFFVPLMIGTGGNAGSQTTTTIVRAMATGDVRFGDARRVMWKEMRVGVLLGVSMAAIGAVRAATWGTGGDLAIVVGLGLMCVVLLATFVGSVLPLVLRRLRLDPAVVSAPFITTFVDGIGLLIYFLLARAILEV